METCHTLQIAKELRQVGHIQIQVNGEYRLWNARKM